MQNIVKEVKGRGEAALKRARMKMEELVAEYREEADLSTETSYNEEFYTQEISPGSFVATESKFNSVLETVKSLSSDVDGNLYSSNRFQTACDSSLARILTLPAYRGDAYALSETYAEDSWTIRIERRPGEGPDVMPREDRTHRNETIARLKTICGTAITNIRNEDTAGLPVGDALVAWGKALSLLNDTLGNDLVTPIYTREAADAICTQINEGLAASRLLWTILRPQASPTTRDMLVEKHNQLVAPFLKLDLFRVFGEHMAAADEALKRGGKIPDPFKTGEADLGSLFAQMLATETTLGYFESVPAEEFEDAETGESQTGMPLTCWKEEEMPVAEPRRKMIRELFDFFDLALKAAERLPPSVRGKWALLRNTPDYFTDGNPDKGPKLDTWSRSRAEQLVAQVSENIVAHNAELELQAQTALRAKIRGKGTSPYAGKAAVRDIIKVPPECDCIYYRNQHYGRITAASDWEILNRLIKGLEDGRHEDGKGVEFTSGDYNRCCEATKKFIDEHVHINRNGKREKYRTAYIIPN